MSHADQLREHERLLAQQGIQVRCMDLATHVVLERSKVEALLADRESAPCPCRLDYRPYDSEGNWYLDYKWLRQLIREADEAAGLEVGA